MGPEEHEAIPTSRDILTQPCGGMWGAEGRVGRHQEHEEESKLPKLCPLHQSGNGNTTQALCYAQELGK